LISLNKLIGSFLLLTVGVASLFLSQYRKSSPIKGIIPSVCHNHAVEPSSQILTQLDQTFTYFAKGYDMYAFKSADGKSVLKIPRSKMKASFWNTLLPKKWKNPKSKTSSEIEMSFLLARDYLKEQSQMLYLHFGKTNTGKTLTLIDRKNIRHTLALDSLPFYLQSFVPLFGDVVKESVSKNDLKAFKAQMGAFFEMVGVRHAKGLKKTDKMLWWKNYGYREPGLVVEIDLGGIFHENGEYISELDRYGALIRKWVVENTTPEFIDAYDAELEIAKQKSPQEHLIHQKVRISSLL